MESKPSNNGLFKEPWSDLLFVKKIDMEITESVRFWVKHALGPTTKPLESRMTGQWSDRSPETGNYLICKWKYSCATRLQNITLLGSPFIETRAIQFNLLLKRTCSFYELVIQSRKD